MRKINMNLLLHLDALLKEKQVSMAAKRVFITQPAMSASLKQLRHIFSDPLLVKVGNSMEMTQKAQELLPELHNIIDNVEVLLEREVEFDPARLERVFNIAIPNYLQSLILPKLEEILVDLPGIRVNTLNMSTVDDPAMYEFNHVDLAIGTCTRNTIPEQVSIEKLFEQTIVCYGSQTNALLDQPISLDHYLKASHIAVSFNEELYNPSAEILKKQSMARNDVVYVPGFLPAVHIVANSPTLISSGPEFFIKLFKETLKLQYQALPFEVPPTAIYIGHHSKFASNKAIHWFKGLILEVIQTEIVEKYKVCLEA